MNTPLNADHLAYRIRFTRVELEKQQEYKMKDSALWLRLSNGCLFFYQKVVPKLFQDIGSARKWNQVVNKSVNEVRARINQ